MKIQCIDSIRETREYEIITGLGETYDDIEQRQNVWKSVSSITCPDGCGTCCVNFEPDVLESEALYLSAWLLDNDPEKADAIADGTFIPKREPSDTGCFLFDSVSPWHCTVYGGRCLICRLFGYSGDYGKNGTKRWKPCRFYPSELLEQHKPPLTHRQYEEMELQQIFSGLPPAMSDCIRQALALTPESDGTTEPLHEALPKAIKKLKLILAFNDNNNDNNGAPMSA